VEELHGDPTVGPHPKVWTKVKNGRSGAKDGSPERLRCETIQKVIFIAMLPETKLFSQFSLLPDSFGFLKGTGPFPSRPL